MKTASMSAFFPMRSPAMPALFWAANILLPMCSSGGIILGDDFQFVNPNYTKGDLRYHFISMSCGMSSVMKLPCFPGSTITSFTVPVLRLRPTWIWLGVRSADPERGGPGDQLERIGLTRRCSWYSHSLMNSINNKSLLIRRRVISPVRPQPVGRSGSHYGKDDHHHIKCCPWLQSGSHRPAQRRLEHTEKYPPWIPPIRAPIKSSPHDCEPKKKYRCRHEIFAFGC